MLLEIDDAVHRRLLDLTRQHGYASVADTIDELAKRELRAAEEREHLRQLVQDGLRSAEEEELVDGETFFQELRSRRAKAA